MDDHAVKKLGSKLGICSSKILRRAQELIRLCQLRCTSLAMNGTCQAVMCLELASTEMDHPTSRASAVQLSGVNKKVYTNSFKTLQTLLDLQPTVTLRDLAVQFGCIGVVDSAQVILKSYRQSFEKRVTEAAKDEVDFSKPLFTGAAMYTESRRQKIRIDKTKLLDIVGVKRSTFDKLCAEMEKHATRVLGEQKSTSSKRHHSWLDDLEKSFEDEVSPPKQGRKAAEARDSQLSDYEEWRRKILENTDDAAK
ncbi:origin recognition complex subunit 6-like [Diadema antillarum]|uniref:origin recognition complex subunit 6-like n=1 Tax=Diadema antillarum TaxID=105358 RepID=UPI003A8B28D7